MTITHKNHDDLNVTVSVKLSPEDYSEKVKSSIKKYRKNVTMPGFRPGMVPEGMVRKMYGKAILFDELNAIVSDSLNKYISEKQLSILGNPLPQPLKDLDINWDKPGEYVFLFDLGLAPEIKVTLPPDHSFDSYEIAADDERVQLYIEDMRIRYGKFSRPDTADQSCMLYGNIEELDETGEVKAGGIQNKSCLINLEKIKNEPVKNLFIGSGKGAIITFKPSEAFAEKDELAALLHITADEVSSLHSTFRFTVESVNKRELADLNQEFYTKLYGEGKINNEEEFREQVKKEIESMYRLESEHKLRHDLEDYFIDSLKVSLPDDFLKRWMKAAAEKKTTDEEVENDYSRYKRSLQWRLIQTNIYKNAGMNITEEEITNYAKAYVRNQFLNYGYANPAENSVNDLASRFVQKEENVRHAVESLTGRKVFEHLSGIIKKDVKKVSYPEFTKIVSEHQHHHH